MRRTEVEWADKVCMDKDVRIVPLAAEVAELMRLLAAALDEKARLKRTSRTSSKPPSSDSIPKGAVCEREQGDLEAAPRPNGEAQQAGEVLAWRGASIGGQLRLSTAT